MFGTSLMSKALLKQTLAIAVLAAVSLPAIAADDLAAVLSRLDASSKTFKSAQADILWDHVQTRPIEDTDSQAGNILVAREGGETRLALHIKTDNGVPALKDMVYAGGTGKMYTPTLNQVEVFKVGDNKAALDAFLTLGFGGSGQDLNKAWIVTLLGNEQINGIAVVKLQLIPRDPAIAKATPKVFLWIDLKQGIAVKQQRFQSDGNYLAFTYSNIRVNGKLPSGAFDLKTPAGTRIINH